MRILSILAIFSIATIQAVQAQSDRELVLQQMVAATSWAESEGMTSVPLRADGPLIGSLGPGGRVELEITLEHGREYSIAAFCDSDCNDIDLAVLNGRYEVIDSDYLVDDSPVVSIAAGDDGPHMIRIEMAECAASYCVFGVVMFTSGD